VPVPVPVPCACGRARTVTQDCPVIRRITSVMTRPMTGSAKGTPIATTAAEAITASDTYASARA